jgi:hypothetical protein
MSLDKTFDEINETDIRLLIENQVSERKNIEYKLTLPENKYDSKKEFLADVSSFANTMGGHLIYGIKEENGIPIEVSGISNNDFDSEILRLENLLRDGIQPRVQGISMKAVNTELGKPMLIIRVPQSWSKPHVVNFQGHWRFYARNSAGKYPLDVIELKSVFLSTTALGERIRNFHFDRLSKIGSSETPVPLEGKARIVFHLIPYSAFETNLSTSSLPVDKDIWSLPLIYSSIAGYRYNLVGLLVYSERGNNLSGAYTQIFRNGIIESVSARLFGSGEGIGDFIPSAVFEEELIRALKTCIALYQKLSILPPSVLLVSLMGVKGYKLAVNQRLDPWRQQGHKIDRDSLYLPEVLIEDPAIDTATILQPVFDAVWNSAGWMKSFGYDESGEWGKGPNFR